jgi:hypothetical protein
LLAAVATGILKGGGEVVAVVDRSPRAEWLRRLPQLASRPSVLREGFGWLIKIAGARIPVLFGHAVVSATGERKVDQVTVAPISDNSSDTAKRFVVDALCVGDGLAPGSEVPKLLRAQHQFDRRRGGWVPILDDDGRTSIKGLYAAGDGAGIRGADPAVHAGTIAGLAASLDAGRLSAEEFARYAAEHRHALARMQPFSDAMADLMSLRPEHVKKIHPETIVCRCEDVARAEIDAAVDAGAIEINQLKHFTRCGMGPCQGRMCGDVTAEILALRVGGRERAGMWTGRPPLRPVPLADLVGSFAYSDIPIPEPAPL